MAPMTKHAAPRRALQWALAFLVTNASLGDANACTLAIKNVAVVAMTTPAIARDQTVTLVGAKIAAIGPAPDTSRCGMVIDGRGGFLGPGLTDAHVHVESGSFAPAFGAQSTPIDFDDVLALYPAFGITSVRVMSGARDILRFRDRAPGTHPVPRLVVASPMIAGRPPILAEPVTLVVETPEAAHAAVARFKSEGYDLIKLRENLRPDVHAALVAAARDNAISLDGHVTRGVAVDALLAAGQRGFAHLDEIARAIASGGTSAAALKRHGAHVSSTMVVLDNAVRQIEDYDGLASRPQMRALHPMFVDTFWSRAQNPYAKPGVDAAFFKQLLALTKSTLHDLTREGVMILAGSDALNPMIIPGDGLHEELRLMVEAGLTPYEALRTATVNPARVIGRLANTGAIAPGRDADLVLLPANPLADVAAYRRPDGVVLQGRWFDRAALDSRLDDVARRFR